MIIKALNKEWEVNDCTYKQRRELHSANAKVWWSGEMDVEMYYSLLEKVSDIAGYDEEELSKLSMSEIDALLQATFMEYLGLNNSKKKSTV